MKWRSYKWRLRGRRMKLRVSRENSLSFRKDIQIVKKKRRI
jgi:hypothetical protein